MDPFSIYLHIPYCDSKCPYCDFNSYAVKQWPEEAYAKALMAELRGAAGETTWRDRVVRTVFIGGTRAESAFFRDSEFFVSPFG